MSEDRRFLTTDEILKLCNDKFKRDTPPGVTPVCAYCGAHTSMPAYTDMESGRSWPSCCSRSDCIDKWEPLDGN